jgi:hypothetical protein
VTLEAVLDATPVAHVVARFGVAAAARPAENVSVTDVTVIAVALLLPIVMVSVEMPFVTIVAGAKALAIVGETEVTVSVAVLDTGPVAVCVVDTPEVVFGFAPIAVPRTTIVTVHERLAGTEIPVNASAVWFAAKTFPPAPAHVPPAGPALSITMPESGSVNAPFVSANALALVSVKVMVLVVPSGIDAGEKAFAIVGAPATDSDADAAVPAGAWVLVAVLVVFVIEDVVVTDCVIVQLPFGGITPALNPTEAPPFTPPVSTALPPAVHATLPAAEFVRPAGYASPIATPVRFAGFADGFETTIVMAALPAAGIEVGAKDFVTVGAAKTLSVADDDTPVPALPVEIGPVLLRYAPAAAAVTFTVIVHEDRAGTVAPVSDALAAPALAVTVPVHPAPLTAPFGVAVFTRPAG